jgi:hypothetical protein
LFEFLLTLSLDFCTGTRVTATNNGVLNVFTEIISGAKKVRVCEVEEGEIFREIILDGSSGKDDSSLDIERVQGLECLIA